MDEKMTEDDRSPAEIVRQVTSGVRLLGAQLLDPADPLRQHPNLLAHALIGLGMSLSTALAKLEAREAAAPGISPGEWFAGRDQADQKPRFTDGHLHPPTIPYGHRDWAVHSGHLAHRHDAKGRTEWRASPWPAREFWEKS